MQINIPSGNVLEITQITPNLSFQWLYGGRVSSVEVDNFSREDVEFYFQFNRALLYSRPPYETVITLHNVNSAKFTLSPIFRHELQTFINEVEASAYRGYFLILLPSNSFSQFLVIAARAFRRMAKKSSFEVFVDIEKAHQRVQELLAELE